VFEPAGPLSADRFNDCGLPLDPPVTRVALVDSGNWNKDNVWVVCPFDDPNNEADDPIREPPNRLEATLASIPVPLEPLGTVVVRLLGLPKEIDLRGGSVAVILAAMLGSASALKPEGELVERGCASFNNALKDTFANLGLR
jgi:hypothetical protein